MVISAAVLLASASRVEAAQAHLLYTREAGADRCPDESQVRGAVTARLGYDPFSERPLNMVSVTLQRSARGYKARIELVDATGEVTGARELVSRKGDCAELASAVELAISLAIDPLSFADASPPTAMNVNPNVNVNANVNANVNVNDTPAPTPKPAVAATAAGGAELPRYRFRLGAGAFTALGSSPGVAFGFTVLAGVRRPRWSMNLEARADIPNAQPQAGGTIATALYTGAAVPCFHQLVFAGCALLALGAQVSTGSGFPVSRQVTTFYAAGGVRAAVEVQLTRKLELHVQADLLAPFTHTTLKADDVTLFSTPPVSGVFHVAMLGYFR